MTLLQTTLADLSPLGIDTMTDLYLKFADEAECLATLFHPAGAEGDPRVPKYRNIDVVGVIYKPTGTTTVVDGVETPQVAPLPGYHANVRLVDGEDATALMPFAVVPAAPVRVWA